MLSSGGCPTILMEIPKKGHGHLSPELHMAHWFGVVLLATFHTEDICIYYCKFQVTISESSKGHIIMY
jgi:hypothetical protein